MLWFPVTLGIILALPFIRELARKPMTNAERRDAPGQFVKLSQGITHYGWIGPGDGPVTLCIHGLSTPSFVFRGMADELAAMGFRVLIFDLYGRGYSDRPRGIQDAEFFNRQIKDLLVDQKVGDDLTVIGYSMGGAIAAGFVAENPARVRRMILLAPAGTAEVNSGLMRKLIEMPLVGDWLMQAFYPRILRKGIEAERTLPSSVPDIGDQQLQQLEYRGFMPAIIASLRGILAEPKVAEHSRLAEAGVPVLAIWGNKDQLIRTAARGRLTEFNPGAAQEVIDDAGHGLTYTHTGEVMAVLRRWIDRRGGDA